MYDYVKLRLSFFLSVGVMLKGENGNKKDAE